GPFAEAQPHHPKILDFRGDDCEALKILMHIIHFQFPQVPTSLTVTVFHRMSILTDKYMATSLVTPWIPRWVEALEHTIDSYAPLWVWITWEYGLIDIFDRVAYKLSMEISLDDRNPGLDNSRGSTPAIKEFDAIY